MTKSFLNDYYYCFDERDKVNRIIYFNKFANLCNDQNFNSERSLKKYQYHNTDIKNAKYKNIKML